MNITVWNEFRHEKNNKVVNEIYPRGIHGTIKEFLEEAGYESVDTATLDEPSHGLTDDVLDQTDLLS